jgi:NAD(P)-dependent dehydrogenase (short-subunit alcohol dehydrogenase family)
MPSIAIVGAGARLGLSLAKVFGRQGFDVAMIARNEQKLAGFADQLAAEGIKAAGFPADVADASALGAAMDRVVEHFGGVDVLEFGVSPGAPFVGVQDVTVENLRPQIELLCYGAVTATRAALAAGASTLLFTTGASSVMPVPTFGTAGVAGAAMRNWALNLNAALADKGVYVGHVAIGVWITGTPAPDGATTMDPDEIADIHWSLYTNRTPVEHLIAA